MGGVSSLVLGGKAAKPFHLARPLFLSRPTNTVFGDSEVEETGKIYSTARLHEAFSQLQLSIQPMTVICVWLEGRWSQKWAPPSHHAAVLPAPANGGPPFTCTVKNNQHPTL